MRIKSLGAGSAKYGVCEVCEKEVGTTYLAAYEEYLLFGHEECLINQQPNG